MRWLAVVATILVMALLILMHEDAPLVRETTRVESGGEPRPRQAEVITNRTGRGAGERENLRMDAALETRRINERRSSDGLWVAVVFDDGSPAVGAEVGCYMATHVLDPLPVAAVHGRTDWQGVVRLAAWQGGAAWVHARHRGLVAGPVNASATGNVRLRLGEPHHIRGVVLGPAGGASRLMKVLFWDGWQRREVTGWTSRTGAFSLLPVPRRWIQRMDVQVHAGASCVFSFDRPVTNLRLQLTSEIVRGRVIDPDGRPVPNLWVHCGPWDESRTDMEGRFAHAFQRREGATLRVGNLVRVLKASEADVEFVLKSGRPLRGQVLTHDRKPVAGVRVDLGLPPWGTIATDYTKEDGRFRFAFVDEELSYQLRVLGTEIEYLVRNVRAADPLIEVMRPRPIPLHFRLVGADGRALDDFDIVRMIVVKGEEELMDRRHRLAGNEFSFSVWEPGEYGVLAIADSYLPARLRVRVTEAGPNVFDLPVKRRGQAR